MAPRLSGAKRKEQFSTYRRHSEIVQLRSMFRIIFKEASNNYPWLEWVKSGLFFPKISSLRRGWTFHSAFKETLRLCATPQRVEAFSISGVIWPCTFLFYSISFFLSFFFCLSLNNRQITVISTLLWICVSREVLARKTAIFVHAQ